MYRYAVPQDNFGQLEKLAGQQNEIALQKAMQPSTGQRLIGAATGIGHSLLDYDRGRKKREFDERKDLAMRAMSRNDYEFDINQVQNWVTTGQGIDGSKDIPVKKVVKEEKPQKLMEATEYAEPDGKGGYTYVRITADPTTGKLKEDKQPTSEAHYNKLKAKEAAGPRADKLEKAESDLIQSAGWDPNGVDKYGNAQWKRLPKEVAIKNLTALRASYLSQRNMPAVNHIDNQLAIYNIPAIGDGKTDLTPGQIAKGWKRINDQEIQGPDGTILKKPLVR